MLWFQDMLSGGIETSATTVEWAMSEIIKNPRAMEKAQAEVRHVFGVEGSVDERGLQELKYLKAVIKESLRLHPPAPLLIPREGKETCKIFGYEIPAKTKITINAWAIGRDPKYWIEPERFYPERFMDSSVDYMGNNFEFIPFGGGRRMCPGMLLAIINVEVPLALFLYHFNWKLPYGRMLEELDMTERFGVTVRRKNELRLIPEYSPAA